MKKIYLLFATIFTIGVGSSNAQCFADFQFFTNGSTVNFQDSSSYSPQSAVMFDWNYGDGSFGFGTNPSHTYSSNGTYNVCLTIYDSLQTCFDTICKTIVIMNNQPQNCMVSITYSITNNNQVSFITNLTGGVAPYTYYWDFGNGTNSTIANPTYTYANAGSYVATLLVSDSNGDTCFTSTTINISTCSADFASNVGSNGSVSFTNLSSPLNGQVITTWNFGDGTGSNLTNPTHSYTTSNLYVVTLSTYDSLNNCSASYSDTINVQIGSQSSCNASYTIAKDSSLAFGVILYNTSSNLGSHFYTWNFGDGTTGSGRTPIHQYQSFGSYVVCLTITDSILNCTSTFCDTVGMDTLGNLKAGFGLSVQNPVVTSITEVQDLNAVNIYPNPATSNISIDLTTVKENVILRIYDLTGKVVLEKTNQTGGNVEHLEISNLSNGLYFITLDNGVTNVTKKFIKR